MVAFFTFNKSEKIRCLFAYVHMGTISGAQCVISGALYRFGYSYKLVLSSKLYRLGLDTQNIHT